VTLVVEATLSGLPEGARVVAPSAKDRPFQKVTKSGHAGAKGAVYAAANGDLFFVSDPAPAAGGPIQYEGRFELVRRPALMGSVASLGELRFAAGEAQEPPKSADAALLKAGADLGLASLAPAAAFAKVAEAAGKWTLAPDGSDDPAQVVAGQAGSPLGLARAVVALAGQAALPARVAQGLQHDGLTGKVAAAHAWAEVQLPRLGWTPLDPALALRQGRADEVTGRLPADRVQLVEGDAVTLGLGKAGELTVSGRLAEPFATKDGQRVGSVTWSARFEPVAAAPAP
jgi:hypothetical protein